MKETIIETTEGEKRKPLRVILSGGGTGGHIFPAIAVADALVEMDPRTDILFVGASGKMEMEKVPRAGYPIEGLWISGFHRRKAWRNLLFPLKLAGSLGKAWRILRRFRPDVVAGFGGFASGPVLEMALRMGIPALVQEQNSYAGMTNRLLGKRVDAVCVAYDHMERYFPPEKIRLTGNPVRRDLLEVSGGKEEARRHFGLDPERPVIFIFGGSLGAKSINEAVAVNRESIAGQKEVQLLWQVGQLYYSTYERGPLSRIEHLRMQPFVERMDLAYAAADVVVCRAGAITVSELCLMGKAAILIPSPNVAEDHQTKNARALVEKNAAVMLPDEEAAEKMWTTALELLADEPRREKLKENIARLGHPDAANQIAKEILKLTNRVYESE